MLDQITPVLLTFNEENNIERTLSKLQWAKDIVIVDSGSSDRTREILEQYPIVRLFSRDFDRHADQWNFAISQTRIETPWILALDADYRLSDELVEEMQELNPADSQSGFSASFTYCVNGKPIRGSLYPPVTVLFRCHGSEYVQDGHTQRIHVNGKVGSLNGCIYHDDRKSFRRWFSAQKRYARLEALQLQNRRFGMLTIPDRVRKLVVIAPIAVPFYILIIRGAALSGLDGLRYAGERMLAELLLSWNIFKGFFHKI